MIHRYIPIIRWKRGERAGLKHLSVSGKIDVQPLIAIGIDQFKGKKATKVNPAVPPPIHLADELASDWGIQPFFLDASALSNASAASPIAAIAQQCRVRGLRLVPATSLSAMPAYTAGVMTVAGIDGRGVGLRVDLQEMTSASAWISSWPLPMSETDLIVDLSNNVSTIAALGASLGHAFSHLHGGGSWRSVTVAGTSMPDDFAGLTAGTYLIPRHEVTLWQNISSSGLGYRLDYGDYTTVALGTPPPGIAWGYPINVRYTKTNEFLICRGVRTTGFAGVDMEPQLVGHAKSIVAHHGRGALPCWSDSQIDDVAAGKIGPSGLEHWVRLGVNRHIELVRSWLP